MDVMPIHEYRCAKCRKRFSYEQSISEHGKRRPACPKCKSRAVEPISTATRLRGLDICFVAEVLVF